MKKLIPLMTILIVFAVSTLSFSTQKTDLSDSEISEMLLGKWRIFKQEDIAVLDMIIEYLPKQKMIVSISAIHPLGNSDIELESMWKVESGKLSFTIKSAKHEGDIQAENTFVDDMIGSTCMDTIFAIDQEKYVLISDETGELQTYYRTQSGPSVTELEPSQHDYPASFLGLKHFDTPLAHIYSKDQKSSIAATAQIHTLASDIENKTGQKIAKGILILLEPETPHPIYAVLESVKKYNSKKTAEHIETQARALKDMGINLDDTLKMSTVTIPFFLFNTIVNSEQNDAMEDQQKATAAVSQKRITTMSAGPWVLCLPSKDCSAYAIKEIIPKVMRSQLGFAKYLLIKPFMGIIRKKAARDLANKSKVTIFDTLIDSISLSEDQKIDFKKQYAAQFEGKESE
jgi:hypothetical protein